MIKILLLIFSVASFAANEPVFIQGQQESNKTKIRDFQTPNKQATKLAADQFLVETGNTNILSNPSFEHQTFSTGWTNSVGTFTQETSVLIDGKASAKLVLSAQTMSLTQSSTLYAVQFADGVQGLAMVRIKSDIALKVCSTNNGTVSTTNCVTTNTDSKWGLYKIPFILGATSNGISIASSGSVSGTVYVDDAFVGAINLESQNGACITADCTTTFSAKVSGAAPGVVTGENLDFINGSCTRSGTGSQVATCGFNSGTFTVTPNCQCSVGNPGPLGATNLDCVIDSTNTNSSQVVVNTSANATASAREFTVSCQKQGADFTQAEAKKTGNVFTTQCGANCVDTFSAKVSAAGIVSGKNVDWINGNCTVSSGLRTCTLGTSLVTVPMNCAVAIDSNNGYATITTNTSSTIAVQTSSTATVSTAYPFEIICQKQGADFVATRNIVGSFNEVVTSPGISKPKVCHYAFGGASATLASPTECTSGTCVEVYDSCGTGTPPSWGATALYAAITWASGTWANSSYIECRCTGFDVTTGATRECLPSFTTAQNSWSTNSNGGYVTSVYGDNGGGLQATMYTQITCSGSAP